MQLCGLAEAFLNSARRQCEASGMTSTIPHYEKDNLLSFIPVLFTFLWNSINNQKEDLGPQREDACWCREAPWLVWMMSGEKGLLCFFLISSDSLKGLPCFYPYLLVWLKCPTRLQADWSCCHFASLCFHFGLKMTLSKVQSSTTYYSDMFILQQVIRFCVFAP